MENSIVMNGGEGPQSYFKNSKLQGQFLDTAKVLLFKSIKESLDVKNQSQIFSIGDLGCSVGPNTFSCVDSIIEAVKHKYETQVEGKFPEFHVFFNDQVSNDFNTLFKALPSDRQYMAAGVPGSFYGRLFPKSSMNLMHSSSSLHWLQRVPKEVAKRDSPSWNKGRITYAKSSIQVVNAFRDQFFNGMNDFLKARSEELAPGGLLAILMPSRPEGTSPCGSAFVHYFECLGDALADMVQEGMISEDLADNFNIPVFFPSAAEVKEIVVSSGISNLSVEVLEKIHTPSRYGTLEDIHFVSGHYRAAMEGIVREYFGSKLVDEIFDRFSHKLESLSRTPLFTNVKVYDNLFLLVKRKDDPQIMHS